MTHRPARARWLRLLAAFAVVDDLYLAVEPADLRERSRHPVDLDTEVERLVWIVACHARPLRRSGGRSSGGYHRRMAAEPLQRLLQEAFLDATDLRVEDRTGGGDHFQVIIATPRFDGLPLLEQHRLVNDALAAPLRDGTIHELRIKTKGTE